jgi:hypothetical protein
MRRQLDLLVAAAIVAGGAAIATSGRLPRPAARRHAPPIAAAASAPAPSAAAARGEEALFGAAPRPAFRTLRRAEFLELNGQRLREHVYTVRDGASWRSAVRDSVMDDEHGPPGLPVAARRTESEMHGTLDLFRDFWSYSMSVDGDGTRLATAATSVTDITGASGRLFPLAVGNRLAFRTVERGTAAVSGMGRDETRSTSWELRVTGVEAGYPASTPAVPGPVYVIDVVMDGGSADESQHLEVHYAPALGAAVRICTLDEGPGTEERLISWEPAR